VLNLNQDVMSGSDGNLRLVFQVFDNRDQQVLQAALDNQPVTGQAITSLSTQLNLPPTLSPGQYTVKVGAFSVDGATRFAWSDSAGTFVVANPPPTPTPLPVPPADDAPSDLDASSGA
jgi:hypothetical protein